MWRCVLNSLVRVGLSGGPKNAVKKVKLCVQLSSGWCHKNAAAAGSWHVCILISYYAIWWQDLASSSRLSNRNFVQLTSLCKRNMMLLEHAVMKIMPKKSSLNCSIADWCYHVGWNRKVHKWVHWKMGCDQWSIGSTGDMAIRIALSTVTVCSST